MTRIKEPENLINFEILLDAEDLGIRNCRQIYNELGATANWGIFESEFEIEELWNWKESMKTFPGWCNTHKKRK